MADLLDRIFGADRAQRYHGRFVFRAESRVLTQQGGYALLKVYDAEEAQAVTLRVYDLLGVEGDSRELATTMWQSELRILTRLLPEEWRRPGLVRFVDGNEDRPTDTMYVAWEDSHRATLAEALADPRIVGAQLHEVPTRVDLMVMLCEALFELHSQGVIHREITPDTICLWDQKPLRAAITGFGMSIFMNNYLWVPAPDSFSASPTRLGQLTYVAPERFAFLTNSMLDVNGMMVQPGEDYRQDIYSLGVCLVEWFTRPLPVDRAPEFLPAGGGYDEYAHLEWVQEQVQGRITREPLSNSVAAQAELKRLLLDMTEFSPDVRIATAGELLTRARQVQDLFQQVVYRDLLDQPFVLAFSPRDTAGYLDWTEPLENPRVDMDVDDQAELVAKELEADLQGPLKLGFPSPDNKYAKDGDGAPRWYVRGERRVYLLERFHTKGYGRECPWLAYLTHIAKDAHDLDGLVTVPLPGVEVRTIRDASSIATNSGNSEEWGRWDDLVALLLKHGDRNKKEEHDSEGLVALAALSQALRLKDVERDPQTYAMTVIADRPDISHEMVPMDAATRELEAAMAERLVTLQYDPDGDARYVDSTSSVALFEETSQRRKDFPVWLRQIANSPAKLDLLPPTGVRAGARVPFGILIDYDVDARTLTLRMPPNSPGFQPNVLVRQHDFDPTLRAQRRGLERLRTDNYRLGLLANPADAYRRLPEQPHAWLTGAKRAGQEPDQNKLEILGACLAAHPAFFLQGPPGTGKTTTAAEVVAQILHGNAAARILVSAQANDALDTLLEGVLDKVPGLKECTITRLPARFHTGTEQVRELYPLAVVDSFARLSDRRVNQFVQAQRRAQEDGTSSMGSAADIAALEALASSWQGLLQSRHSDLERVLLRSANLVFATCHGTERLSYHDVEPFDWVIVEEAGRAAATELLLPLLRAHRWLLIGDHLQMRSFKADVFESAFRHSVESELKETLKGTLNHIPHSIHSAVHYLDLFAHLFRRATRPQRAALTKCYRMHPALVELVDRLFYRSGSERKLYPAKSREQRSHPFRLTGEDGVDRLSGRALVWLDTSTDPERREDPLPPGGSSHRNAFETQHIRDLVAQLRDQDPKATIMLLSVYEAQHKLLHEIAAEYAHGVRAFTVMACQGKEADVVLLSLTRSNTEERPRTALGSITKPNDLNVALSRARSLLVVVGDANHVRAFGEDAGKLGELLNLIENWPDKEHASDVGLFAVPALHAARPEALRAEDSGSDQLEEGSTPVDLIDLPPDTIDALYDFEDSADEVTSE